MTKQLTPLEALEKIDHSICIAFNQNNKALFNKDQYDHCDCKDINEYCECEELVAKHLKALEIIKKLNPYTLVEVQGQWYLMIGDIFVKATKIPITDKQASLLMEVLK